MTTEIFEPRWAFKPTQKLLLKIEQKASEHFGYKTEARLHHDEINNLFGHQSHALPKFMSNLLLAETDNYIPHKQSKEYIFNWNNLLWAFIKSGLVSEDEACKFTNQKVINKDVCEDGRLWLSEFITNRKAKLYFDTRFFEVHNRQLLTENAVYEEDVATTRWKSPFQNKPREVKANFFRGWYDLDIDACAYCLIHQHLMVNVIPAIGKQQNSLYSSLLFNSDAKSAISEHFGSVLGKIDDVVKYEIWPKMYNQKREMRQYFANAWGVDIDTVKAILAAVLFDAKLSHNPKSGVYKAVVKGGFDPLDFYSKADADPVLKKLIIELQDAWPKLFLFWNMTNEVSGFKIYSREHINKETGEITTRFRPASFRARIYFELERKVIDVIRKNIDQDVIHLMHDGVIIKHEVKVDHLVKAVKDELGFDINISIDQL